MQTIKTAAVVVLMLTVLYGGYVSLTTPPEPLPDEIEGILVIEEAGIGFGGPEAFASNFELGQPPTGVLASAPDAPQAMPSMSLPQPPMNAQTTSDRGANDAASPSYGSSFADLPPRPPADDIELASSSSAAKKLPAVSASYTRVNPMPADRYASTPSGFELPDPESAAANFDPSRGEPFEGESTEFQISDASPTATDSLGAAELVRQENRGLINAFATADALYEKGQLKEALATLSVFYGMPNLTDSQWNQLLSRLDPLARDVIYSKRHLLEQPHRVTSSETLFDIAERFDVPVQLLANINGVADPVAVLPGTELKTVRGPFRAEVDLTKQSMTLFLGDLYAGRFAVAVGSDPTPSPGTFTVQEKQTTHVYYDRAGTPIPAGSPNNPYGNMWLDLGGQICIHGSPNTVQPSKTGCISVAGDYADDVYGILSQGSSVTIRR